MLHQIAEGLHDLFGPVSDDLTVWQMSLRALFIYVIAILLVRVGQKRFMGRNSAFDVILGIILGSVLSRAITGNAPFIPTVAAGASLVALHWLLSVASYHSDFFGSLVKGREKTLIKNGEIHWDNMRKSHISKRDLEMALRNAGECPETADIAEAHFERSGDISVIPREKQLELKVLEIAVSEGVQRVRIELA